ncbi:hypothetical protein GH714_018108 [Hevea brasiliensis]|uniref:Aspergillus nuclease S1 n=1 Tax=Hevea brasiliensis TaxID=3981 RepID=A0A6A6LPR8_HEVBR|nr:hypothetical protein GH714_018108 [Hevea brasiliensis]
MSGNLLILQGYLSEDAVAAVNELLPDSAEGDLAAVCFSPDEPLHFGFTGDLGGNTITVHWCHMKTNLHHVWDNIIIDSALKTFYGSDLANMIQAIQNYDAMFFLLPSVSDC